MRMKRETIKKHGEQINKLMGYGPRSSERPFVIGRSTNDEELLVQLTEVLESIIEQETLTKDGEKIEVEEMPRALQNLSIKLGLLEEADDDDEEVEADEVEADDNEDDDDEVEDWDDPPIPVSKSKVKKAKGEVEAEEVVEDEDWDDDEDEDEDDEADEDEDDEEADDDEDWDDEDDDDEDEVEIEDDAPKNKHQTKKNTDEKLETLRAEQPKTKSVADTAVTVTTANVEATFLAMVEMLKEGKLVVISAIDVADAQSFLSTKKQVHEVEADEDQPVVKAKVKTSSAKKAKASDADMAKIARMLKKAGDVKTRLRLAKKLGVEWEGTGRYSGQTLNDLGMRKLGIVITDWVETNGMTL